MKRIYSLLLIFLMLLYSASFVPAVYAAPEGTAISSAADFAAMKPDGNYYLDADITLERSYEKEFTGTFDGNGRSITISAPMFTLTNNAYIGNFTVNGDINTKKPGHSFGSEDFFAAVAVVANGASVFENIISNVKFTSTSTNTRYGAIVATSGEGHALTINRCINNGNISVRKYAGGIYGWTDKSGTSSVTNCVNNGKVYAWEYCGGIIARLGTSSGSLIIENCINNNDITSKSSYCGGIYAYSNTATCVSRCINNGNITASNGNTGGIGGSISQTDTVSAYVFKYNINNGNVSNGSGHTGGIIGYVYATGNCYAEMIGNINFGTISTHGYVSQIIAYTNSSSTKIIGNIGAGKTETRDKDRAVIVGLSSADITKYKIVGNYYLENDGTKNYSFADSNSHASNRKSLESRPEGSVYFITAEQLASGEISTILNDLFSSNIFEVRDGKTLIKCRHEYPEAKIFEEISPTCTQRGKSSGYKCYGCNKVIGCEIIPAQGHRFENGICTVCEEADPEALEDTSPAVSDPLTSPITFIPVAVGAIALTACITVTVIIIKKKK